MDPEKVREEQARPPSVLDSPNGDKSKEEDVESPLEQSLSRETGVDEDEQESRAVVGLSKTKSLEEQVSLSREILVVGLIALCQFTTQVGLGQTLSILHVIGDSFGVENPGILSWLIAGYSLTVGTFILFTGRLGDLFGWKKMVVIGYCWFALWSLVAGLSVYSNHVLFVFARVFQGLGPAILLPNGLALLGGLYQPGKRKNMVFAVFGASAPGGAVIGSVFSALFSLAWWPWAFFSFAITLTILAIVAAAIIPDPQDEKPGLSGKSLLEAIASLDLFGAVTGITALVLINFAWNQAPIVGWAEAYIIVALVLGVLLVPVFFYIEIKVSRHPLIPFDVFTTSNAFVLACVACGWGNFGIWVFYFWQILEVLRGASPILASAYLVPIAISGGAAAVITGLLLHRLRPATVMIIAMCAFTTGTILVATLPPNQIYWAQIFVTCIVAPFGMDMSFPSATLVVSNSVKKAHQGVAASLVNTIVNYSISLGLGFAGTIEVHINNGGTTASDILHGYRGALYMGIGLAGFGIVLASIFLLKTILDEKREIRKTQQGTRGTEAQ